MARKVGWLDRVILSVNPAAGARRLAYRMVAENLVRHFEASETGRRNQHWNRSGADANGAIGNRGALLLNRAYSRDLVRNNSWARNGKRVVTRNVVGYGITANPVGDQVNEVAALWEDWAGTTQCDAAGRLTFAGLQSLTMGGIFESGEMLIRRRWRRPEDGLVLPLQLQILEPDFLDHHKHGTIGPAGGPIIYGIEFDKIGRRAAYYLYDQHPGSSTGQFNATSSRIPASEIIHVFDVERAGQDRGIPWLVAGILTLKDLDEFDDAQLTRQKIAAMFAAIETDYEGGGDGGGLQLGPTQAATATSPAITTLEPGTVVQASPGKDIKFANPPLTTDDGFSTRTLRRVAAAIGVTYEDLTGDYSQVNFSSARMSRIAHWGNVYHWQWNMLVPQALVPIWAWMVEAAKLASLVRDSSRVRANWTEQPMPMIEPDREARANLVMIRTGQKSLPQVLREQGLDPKRHIQEIAETNALLDKLGIQLDGDPRRMSQAGLTQARPAGTVFLDDPAAAAVAAEAAKTPATDPAEDGAETGG